MQIGSDVDPADDLIRTFRRIVIAVALLCLGYLVVSTVIEWRFRFRVLGTFPKMSALATALEGHYRNHRAYPTEIGALTTPIAFAKALPKDAFSPSRETFFYYANNNTPPGWILWSPGPDRQINLTMSNIADLYNPAIQQPSDALITYMYDPSNGNLSSGDIFRVHDDPRGLGL